MPPSPFEPGSISIPPAACARHLRAAAAGSAAVSMTHFCISVCFCPLGCICMHIINAGMCTRWETARTRQARPQRAKRSKRKHSGSAAFTAREGKRRLENVPSLIISAYLHIISALTSRALQSVVSSLHTRDGAAPRPEAAAAAGGAGHQPVGHNDQGRATAHNTAQQHHTQRSPHISPCPAKMQHLFVPTSLCVRPLSRPKGPGHRARERHNGPHPRRLGAGAAKHNATQ